MLSYEMLRNKKMREAKKVRHEKNRNFARKLMDSANNHLCLSEKPISSAYEKKTIPDLRRAAEIATQLAAHLAPHLASCTAGYTARSVQRTLRHFESVFADVRQVAEALELRLHKLLATLVKLPPG